MHSSSSFRKVSIRGRGTLDITVHYSVFYCFYKCRTHYFPFRMCFCFLNDNLMAIWQFNGNLMAIWGVTSYLELFETLTFIDIQEFQYIQA